jgi:hypothetical protein
MARGTHIQVGSVLFTKRGGVSVGDHFTIPSGCPCFTNSWNHTVEVENTWNDWKFASEYGGKNGTAQIFGDRFQFAQYINLITGVTGSCLSFLLLEAVS